MPIGKIDTDGVIADLLLNGGYIKAEIADIIGSSVDELNASLIIHTEIKLLKDDQEAKLISLYKRCNKCSKREK